MLWLHMRIQHVLILKIDIAAYFYDFFLFFLSCLEIILHQLFGCGAHQKK